MPYLLNYGAYYVLSNTPESHSEKGSQITMDLQTTNPIELEMAQFELRKKESAARTIPYISFILTHAALVLFILTIFIVDRLVPDPTANLFLKVVIVVVGVLLLAGEWIYAIVSSRKWKKDISTLQQIAEAQRQLLLKEKLKQQEFALANERQRNQILQFELEQQRKRRENFRASSPPYQPLMDNSGPQEPFRTWNPSR